MKITNLILKAWVFIGFALLLGNNKALAQTWDAPVYYSEVPVAGTSYYVYNVGNCCNRL